MVFNLKKQKTKILAYVAFYSGITGFKTYLFVFKM